MWLFTPIGFFSCVAHRAEPDTVIVRARDRGDLIRFGDFILDACEGRFDGKELRIRPKSTPKADYAFRFEVPRGALARAMSVFVTEDLDYDNFKNEVAREAGLERAHLYHEVWAAMQKLDPREREATEATRGRDA